jgi:hypothetical protein
MPVVYADIAHLSVGGRVGVLMYGKRKINKENE